MPLSILSRVALACTGVGRSEERTWARRPRRPRPLANLRAAEPQVAATTGCRDAKTASIGPLAHLIEPQDPRRFEPDLGDVRAELKRGADGAVERDEPFFFLLLLVRVDDVGRQRTARACGPPPSLAVEARCSRPVRRAASYTDRKKSWWTPAHSTATRPTDLLRRFRSSRGTHPKIRRCADPAQRHDQSAVGSDTVGEPRVSLHHLPQGGCSPSV